LRKITAVLMIRVDGAPVVDCKWALVAAQIECGVTFHSLQALEAG
jgi:hypothetical protein